MGSQIESGLKEAKSQNMQYLSHENLNFDGPGPPKTGPERVQNWFPIASSTRKPSKSLLRASWSALGGSWSRKKVVGIALGPSWGALGAGKPPNINPPRPAQAKIPTALPPQTPPLGGKPPKASRRELGKASKHPTLRSSRKLLPLPVIRRPPWAAPRLPSPRTPLP